VRFTWSEVKRRSNLSTHDLDFADARQVFEGLTLTYEDARFAYGEQRFHRSHRETRPHPDHLFPEGNEA
jgi:uncharacterized DUF497 family protein